MTSVPSPNLANGCPRWLFLSAPVQLFEGSSLIVSDLDFVILDRIVRVASPKRAEGTEKAVLAR